jgi:hypothetical protein
LLPESRPETHVEEQATTPQTEPTTVLKNFAVYLSAQIGLGETTIANYLSTMRRLFPVLGMRPTQHGKRTR